MKMIQRKLRGLSLLEVMVSMGVFSLMVVSVASIFSTGIASSRSNRAIERNLENAQFVMNKMAKELRTSTVIEVTDASFVTPVVANNVQFYDYSQGLCISYEFNTVDDGARDVINRRSLSVDSDDCTVGALSSIDPEEITTGSVMPRFRIVTSFDGDGDSKLARVGIISMLFEVKEKKTDARSVMLQTSVSLRDYTTSGILH